MYYRHLCCLQWRWHRTYFCVFVLFRKTFVALLLKNPSYENWKIENGFCKKLKTNFNNLRLCDCLSATVDILACKINYLTIVLGKNVFVSKKRNFFLLYNKQRLIILSKMFLKTFNFTWNFQQLFAYALSAII